VNDIDPLFFFSNKYEFKKNPEGKKKSIIGFGQNKVLGISR